MPSITRRIVIWALATLVRAAPTPAPATIPVSGPGVSNHGEPNLVCFPTKAVDILIFFLVNYLAHAGSVRIDPGASNLQAAISVIRCLLDPGSGIGQAMAAISRWSVRLRARFPFVALPADTLETAHRAGALVTASRTEEWAPHAADAVLKGVQLTRREEKRTGSGGDKMGDKAASPAPMGEQRRPKVELYRCRVATGVVEMEESRSAWQWPGGSDIGGRTDPRAIVFGGFRLPPGYRWVRLPLHAEVEPLTTSSPAASSRTAVSDEPPRVLDPSAAPVELGAAYSVVQPIAAVVQTFAAGITLYKTQGDQLERYGFTAFGLTVVPYLLMSIVNFFAQIATPKYNTLFMIDSDILQEAAARAGQPSSVLRVVGKLAPSPHPDPEQLDVTLESEPSGPTGYRVLRYDDPQDPDKSPKDFMEPIYISVARDEDGQATPGPSQRDFAGEVIVPRFSSAQQLSSASGSWLFSMRSGFAPSAGSFFMSLVSLTVIGVISRFQPGSATTPAWKAIFILWLTVTTGNNTIATIALLVIGFLLFLFVRGNSSATLQNTVLYATGLSYLLAAGALIALWVLVVQQLLDYGNCTYFADS